MRSRTTLALLVAAVSALACAPDFAPRSVIENLRVLAIVAEPLELQPGTTSITLTARTVLVSGKAGAPRAAQWSFCPFSLGSSVGYACVSPACEYPIGTGPTVTYDVAVGLQACYAALRASGGLPASVPPDPSAVTKLDLVFRYVAVDLGARDEEIRRETVQTIPLYARAPPSRNLPPKIEIVTVEGTPVDSAPLTAFGIELPTGRTLGDGQELQVCATLSSDSAQAYRDAAGDRVETPVVSFYTTAGRFNFDRANGPVGCVKLKREEISGNGTGRLYLVARDLRGGVDARGPYLFGY